MQVAGPARATQLLEVLVVIVYEVVQSGYVIFRNLHCPIEGHWDIWDQQFQAGRHEVDLLDCVLLQDQAPLFLGGLEGPRKRLMGPVSIFYAIPRVLLQEQFILFKIQCQLIPGQLKKLLHNHAVFVLLQ